MGNHIDAVYSDKKPVHTCGCCGPDESCPACTPVIVNKLHDTMRNSDDPATRLKSAELLLDLLEPPESSVSSDNNGGSTDYYKFDPSWVECGDIIEARDMNYNQGNIFKATFCFNTGRHEGTNTERELNKIIYFAQRELDRIKGN